MRRSPPTSAATDERMSRAAASGGNDVLDPQHEVLGFRELGEQVECVDGVGVVEHAQLLPPCAQRVAVPALPVLQRVVPADDHRDRREVRGVEAGRGGGGREPRVGGLVGAVRAGREERAPRPVGARDGHDGRAVEPQLRRRAALAAEEGLDGEEAGHADAAERVLAERVAAGHVVRDVAARAVAGEEAAGGVERGRAAGVVGRIVEEAEGGDAVVVGGGEPVLGGAAVVDGEDGGAGVPRDAAS
jgi:hypothetical protein